MTIVEKIKCTVGDYSFHNSTLNFFINETSYITKVLIVIDKLNIFIYANFSIKYLRSLL